MKPIRSRIDEREAIFTYGDVMLCRGDYNQVIPLENRFDLIITSPPYNIGSKSPKFTGRRRFGGYDRKSWGAIEEYPDELPEDEYQRSQRTFLEWCARQIKPNGVIVYNHKLRHHDGTIIKPDEWFPSKKILVQCDEVVWDKKSTHNHCKQFTYPQSERLYIFKRPGANIYFRNQNFYWDSSGRHGVGDVWQIPRGRGEGHNAPFPLRLIRHCIRLWCPPNGIVCDPYCGSGTSMLSAFIEGRRFVGSELQQRYYEMAISRFKEHLGTPSGDLRRYMTDFMDVKLRRSDVESVANKV